MRLDVRAKRVYRAIRNSDGRRILVEASWPRGMTAHRMRSAEWAKDLAPSLELRRWLASNPESWSEFERCYAAELDGKPEAVAALRLKVRSGPVTLLFSSKNLERNNAVALKRYLETCSGERS